MPAPRLKERVKERERGKASSFQLNRVDGLCQLLFLGASCVCSCGCHVHTTSFTQLLPGQSYVQVVEMVLESVKKASERVSAKVNKSK